MEQENITKTSSVLCDKFSLSFFFASFKLPLWVRSGILHSLLKFRLLSEIIVRRRIRITCFLAAVHSEKRSQKNLFTLYSLFFSIVWLSRGGKTKYCISCHSPLSLCCDDVEPTLQTETMWFLETWFFFQGFFGKFVTSFSWNITGI